MKVAVWLLSFGLALGLILNVVRRELWAWEGFAFGLFGGLVGILLYYTDGRPWRTLRRFANRNAKPS